MLKLILSIFLLCSTAAAQFFLIDSEGNTIQQIARPAGFTVIRAIESVGGGKFIVDLRTAAPAIDEQLWLIEFDSTFTTVYLIKNLFNFGATENVRGLEFDELNIHTAYKKATIPADYGISAYRLDATAKTQTILSASFGTTVHRGLWGEPPTFNMINKSASPDSFRFIRRTQMRDYVIVETNTNPTEDGYRDIESAGLNRFVISSGADIQVFSEEWDLITKISIAAAMESIEYDGVNFIGVK